MKFSEHIEVTQMKSGNQGISGLLLVAALPVASMFWIIECATQQHGVASVLLTIVGLVVGVVALFGAIGVWGLIGEWWERRQGTTHFSGKTQVTVDAQGVCIEGLGVVGWAGVLALESVPDSDTYLIVHTHELRKLMLSVPSVDQLLQVFHHYMARHAASNYDALSSPSADEGHFRALVFDWPRFITWITLGYVLGSAMWIAIIVVSNQQFVATVLAASGLSAVTAWLVWAIPFKEISLFAPGHMRGFILRGDQLSSTDGRWNIDLARSQILLRRSSGIGYELDFIAIRCKGSPRLDLLLSPHDLKALSRRWGLQRPVNDDPPHIFD